MTEMYKKEEAIDGNQLAKEVGALRRHAVTSPIFNGIMSSKVYDWDKKFKARLQEKYGTTRFAQQVPAWQVLIGGTVENETDIEDEQRSFILKEVKAIVEELKNDPKFKYDS